MDLGVVDESSETLTRSYGVQFEVFTVLNYLKWNMIN